MALSANHQKRDVVRGCTTERIALASSSKELHQIVNTLSNRHPHNILPAIYPSADLNSLFNYLEKHTASVASELATLTSTLVAWTTTTIFSL